jgi:hypothetical protein
MISIKPKQKLLARFEINEQAETGFWIGLGIDVGIALYFLNHLKLLKY